MRAHRASVMENLRGFTLVELMVTLVIALVLMGGVIVVFIANQQAITQAQALSRVQENVRFASDFLVRDIRNAGFRDEASLSYANFLLLGANPAVIQPNGEFGDRLTVSYAGRGNCNETLAPATGAAVKVENEYRVGLDESTKRPVLLCNNVKLVSGVERLMAQGLCADGLPNCVCPQDCVGVLLTLVFEGEGRGNASQSLQLKASFRNRVLESVFQD